MKDPIAIRQNLIQTSHISPIVDKHGGQRNQGTSASYPNDISLLQSSR